MIKNSEIIKNNFLHILNRKPLSFITVSEIIKTSNISKGTFYNNFENIHDLIISIMNDTDKETYNSMLKFDSSKDDLYIFIADNILYKIYENRDRLKILYKPDMKGYWIDYLTNKYLNYIEMGYLNKNFNKNQYLNNKILIMQIIIVIDSWISETITLPPDKFKKIFINIFNNN